MPPPPPCFAVSSATAQRHCEAPAKMHKPVATGRDGPSAAIHAVCQASDCYSGYREAGRGVDNFNTWAPYILDKTLMYLANLRSSERKWVSLGFVFPCYIQLERRKLACKVVQLYRSTGSSVKLQRNWMYDMWKNYLGKASIFGILAC